MHADVLIEFERDFTDFRQTLTLITFEAALNANLEVHLVSGNALYA